MSGRLSVRARPSTVGERSLKGFVAPRHPHSCPPLRRDDQCGAAVVRKGSDRLVRISFTRWESNLSIRAVPESSSTMGSSRPAGPTPVEAPSFAPETGRTTTASALHLVAPATGRVRSRLHGACTRAPPGPAPSGPVEPVVHPRDTACPAGGCSPPTTTAPIRRPPTPYNHRGLKASTLSGVSTNCKPCGTSSW